jgi:homoserine dehydrogenase
MDVQTIRIVLVGLGNLGRRFLELIELKGAVLRREYGLDVRVVAAADSRGVARDEDGLDLATVVRLKTDGGTVADYPAGGQRGVAALDLVETVTADVLCEASPVHLAAGGEPGLSCIRTALSRGMHVVTPNKGPIVLAYSELASLAAEQGVRLRFDGTVSGGLPAINLGARDLRGATIERIEAIPNLVTGRVLDSLASGVEWETAVERVKDEGILEADPDWDLDGWDAAAKLAILANAVLGVSARLEDVRREGIRGVTMERAQRAAKRGEHMRLVALARRAADGSYALRVAPQALRPDHPLGHLGGKQMGIVYETDIYGTITATIEEETPVPSAATMLRDLLDIVLS